MAEIKTIGLFKNKVLSAGDSGTSDIVDLRETDGSFSLSTRSVAGTAGTPGTTVFTYVGSSVRDGVFVAQASASAIGTTGTSVASDITSFTPALMPFMKIIATQTGAGTAGRDSVVDAELIVR